MRDFVTTNLEDLQAEEHHLVQRLGVVRNTLMYAEMMPADDLWSADQNCDHLTYSASGGGIKCVFCPGWKCY